MGFLFWGIEAQENGVIWGGGLMEKGGGEVKKVEVRRGKFHYFFSGCQIAFFVVVGVFTIFNSFETHRINKLIFKPIVGITDIKTVRHPLPGRRDTYPNIMMVSIIFTYENVGNLPAKDFKFKILGKLGNTTLPHTEPEIDKGIHFIQRAKLQNIANIGRNEIVRLVEGKEKLTYTVEISYSDWEGYEYFYYQTRYQVLAVSKEPLELAVLLIP
jgi:hypothetical protein